MPSSPTVHGRLAFLVLEAHGRPAGYLSLWPLELSSVSWLVCERKNRRRTKRKK
jgi:hypothetical protein